MKRLISLFLVLLLSCPVSFADINARDGVTVTTTSDLDGATATISAVDGQTVASGGGGVTYLLQENFEGTGYELVWTEAAGTPDEDYVPTPSIEGTQSLRLNGTSATQRTDSPTFSATTETWFYARFRPEALPSSGVHDSIVLRNGTTAMCTMGVSSTGTLRVTIAGTSANTVGTMTAGTDYHIWIRWVPGTGANAFGSVGFSTDGTRPTSGNNFVQTAASGTGTLGANNVRLTAPTGAAPIFIYDKLRVDDVTIGDNPS